jgi:hypothetical protein
MWGTSQLAEELQLLRKYSSPRSYYLSLAHYKGIYIDTSLDYQGHKCVNKCGVIILNKGARTENVCFNWEEEREGGV